MALSGCHIVCAYAGSLAPQERGVAILGRPLWSETLTAGGSASAKAAPGADPYGKRGQAVIHYRAVVDGYLIIDKAPSAGNATQSRVVAPAGEMLTVYVDEGDKALFVGA
ncbi:hypothetical protein PMI07_000902 [Rhizobium sp. CF080]|uniref:hypothetical protein n=1 Tax=Rhizobium sp. (strain CF080) TaxID=1144310 RepID=UPI000271B4BB|nr:hypothetical protein [Rhizobium sp. CF080]EUB97326.1 hypothetical protein PMI07_000902 [Rhizobium sp. CF080]